MGKRVLLWGVLFLSSPGAVLEAATLTLSGHVERTLSAGFRVDMATQRLNIRNLGNESFKVIVGEAGMSEQVSAYLASVIPAQMQGDFAFKLHSTSDAKNTLNVSIQAP